jgi:hypothetical protein
MHGADLAAILLSRTTTVTPQSEFGEIGVLLEVLKGLRPVPVDPSLPRRAIGRVLVQRPRGDLAATPCLSLSRLPDRPTAGDLVKRFTNVRHLGAGKHVPIDKLIAGWAWARAKEPVPVGIAARSSSGRSSRSATQRPSPMRWSTQSRHWRRDLKSWRIAHHAGPVDRRRRRRRYRADPL